MAHTSNDCVSVIVCAVQKREKWEEEKTEADMEKYFWDISKSRKTVVTLLQTIGDIDKVGTASNTYTGRFGTKMRGTRLQVNKYIIAILLVCSPYHLVIFMFDCLWGLMLLFC